MKRLEFIHKHWSYYTMLEERFISSMQYVSLDEKNSRAFSNEYASLLITAGAEIDILFKMVCGFHGEERKSINDYAKHLLPTVKQYEIEIIISNYNNITPFKTWSMDNPSKSLVWWEAYNCIKHNRAENAIQASQENVILALSALFLLNNLMFQRISETNGCANVPGSYSKLFKIVGWKYNADILNPYLEESIAELAEEFPDFFEGAIVSEE